MTSRQTTLVKEPRVWMSTDSAVVRWVMQRGSTAASFCCASSGVSKNRRDICARRFQSLYSSQQHATTSCKCRYPKT